MAYTINEAHDSASSGSAISVVKSLVKFFEKVYGAVGEYVENADGSAKLLYFQDSSMKDIFNFFPERLCIDVSYKKFEIHMYMYLFSCEDSNGRNHIIAVGFLNTNDADSITWLFNIFKKHNPNWRKIKMIAADPAIKPREVLRLFPQSLIVIAFFHAKTAFKMDVDKINLTDDDQLFSTEIKEFSVSLFTELYTSQNQSEFEKNLQAIYVLPCPIISYIEEVWMATQNEWKLLMDYNHENIFHNLNLFLEELSSCISTTEAAETSSVDFIKKIFIIIYKKMTKLSVFQEPFITYKRFSLEFLICKTLTPYSANLVMQQLHLSSEIGRHIKTMSVIFSVFEYSGKLVRASIKICTCKFYLFTSLPCCHIFAVRKNFDLFPFDQSEINSIWEIKYYEHALDCMQRYHTLSTQIYEVFPSSIFSLKYIKESHKHSESSKVVLTPEFRLLMFKKMFKNIVQSWKFNQKLYLDVEKTSNECFISSPSNLQCASPNFHISLTPHYISLDTYDAQHKHQHAEGNVTLGKQGFMINVLKMNPVSQGRLCCIFCFTKLACVAYLKFFGFIAPSVTCSTCGKEMMCRISRDFSDGVAWCCNKTGEKKNCSERCSIRIGTWFESSNMALEQILLFCYMWINHFSESQITAEIPGLSASSYAFWHKFCQRVCWLSVRNRKSSAFTADDQIPSRSSTSPLDMWLEEYECEGMFIKFLIHCARVHNQDKQNSSLS